MYTRKDFIAAAAEIKKISKKDVNCECKHAPAIAEIAVRLFSSNPRFDRDRFLRACGLTP
jgi:hypothetical protein